MPRWPRRQAFWRDIPARALVNLLLAAGLTFSSMGFLSDIISLDRQPFSNALYSAAVSALTAVCFVLGLARDYRWLGVALVLQIAGGAFISGPARQEPWVGFVGLSAETRLQLDSAGALLAVLSGYNAFLVFIGNEGRRRVAINAELALARKMHQTLVPRIDRLAGPTTFHGLSLPSGQVGGDLVDVIDLPDNEWLAYVADVSGHGVSSGLVMGMVKSAMRMGSAEHPALPLLVARLNRLMCSQLSPGMYVTLAAIRGRRDGFVEVLIAGHPPLLRVSAGQKQVERISANHIPLGIEPEWMFTSSRLPFATDDVLVLVTDGLFEVFDKSDRDLGLDGLVRELAESVALPLSEIGTRLVARSRAFGPQLDDQTILLVRG